MAKPRRSWHYLGVASSPHAEFDIWIARTRAGVFWVSVYTGDPEDSGELCLGDLDAAFDYLIDSTLPLEDCLKAIGRIRGFKPLADLLAYEIELESAPAERHGRLTGRDLSARQSREEYGAGLIFIGGSSPPPDPPAPPPPEPPIPPDAEEKSDEMPNPAGLRVLPPPPDESRFAVVYRYVEPSPPSTPEGFAARAQLRRNAKLSERTPSPE